MRNYTSLLPTLLIVAITSCGESGDTSSWKSAYHMLSFTYRDPWKLLPTLDTKKEALTGVIDTADGKSYVIRTGNDVSKDKLPDEAYYANIKKMMLGANAANRLISEGDTIFHSQQSYQLNFIMKTDKWGWMRQISVIRRDGKKFFSVQITYPIKPGENLKPIPEEIIEFDKSIRINNE